jgi:hypothetical protein
MALSQIWIKYGGGGIEIGWMEKWMGGGGEEYNLVNVCGLYCPYNMKETVKNVCSAYAGVK